MTVEQIRYLFDRLINLMDGFSLPLIGISPWLLLIGLFVLKRILPLFSLGFIKLNIKNGERSSKNYEE